MDAEKIEEPDFKLGDALHDSDVVREAKALVWRRSSKLKRTDEQLQRVIDLAALRFETPDDPAVWMAVVVTTSCFPEAQRRDALTCLMDYLYADDEAEKEEELREIRALIDGSNDRAAD